MNLALAQLEIDPGRVDVNVEAAVDAVERAATGGAELVALPEVFNVGYFAFDSYQRAAEPLSGPTLGSIREAARANDVAVLAGTIVEDLAATSEAEDLAPTTGDADDSVATSDGEDAATTGDTEDSAATDDAEDGAEPGSAANPEPDAPVPAEEGLANTAVLFDSDGERRLVYRKHHLFGYDSAEAELLVGGERVETATIAGVEVGVTTCYDLRFPELYRELVDDGVELVLVPSAWPYPRVEHWQLLPQARAVENLCYVAAVNGAADYGGEASLVGRSAVYDPWGVRVAACGEEPAIVRAACDPERVADVRAEFPALRDRREG